ncbi:AAA family ATPase [Pendulispora brunnea]|uniref:AAA family ATPase n=1 Tax=Pendulispora brunnea TaxID=2905690 RepID=A0ABZ2KC99_9BACT
MKLSFTVPVYRVRHGNLFDFVTLGLGAATQRRSGTNAQRVEELLIEQLRRVISEAAPRLLPSFELKRGTRLERVRISLNLRDKGRKRKASGLCPIIIEPRSLGPDRHVDIAYHPFRQGEWFPLRSSESLADQASVYFSQAWGALDDVDIDALWGHLRDTIRVVSFSTNVKTLLGELQAKEKGIWDDLDVDPARAGKKKPAGGMKVLPNLGVDLTARLAGRGAASLGMPRSPYREQLDRLLVGERKRSTLVVGGHGAGKSVLLERAVADLLSAEDYESHRNLDRVTRVYRIGGKRIISGMSYVGDWERRCVELVEDVRGRKIVLLVSDLHLFGQIGQARDSTRSLADFFRGPVARGEVVMVGEATPEQLRRLEEDAPSFASLFVRVHVQPATAGETFRIMLHRTRELEVERHVRFQPYAYRTILELGAGLFPSQELPGKAVDLATRLAAEGEGTEEKPRTIDSAAVIEHLSRRTGLPWILLSDEKPFAVDEVAEALGGRVFGQPVAIRRMADLVVRIRAGLTDPRRPHGVYLFTGPTGTGKTELAKALAEYLYGSASRLVRFDMSELRTPDAPARLIGDAWNPEGLLTRAALEQPFSVILLDEIEKAHPSVIHLLLQMFDEGRLTDAAGNTASFKQAVIVMTSNLGTMSRAPAGFDAPLDAVLHDVARAVREFFPPELFNRIDGVVPFSPLDREMAILVTRKELGKLLVRPGLRDRNIFVQPAPGVVERAAREAFQSRDGARSLKRFLDDRIASLLSAEIARAPDAAMQMMRLEEGLDGFRVHHHPLVEAKPVALHFALEPLLQRPLSELHAELPKVHARIDRIESSDELRELSDQLRHHLGEHNRGRREHGELLYNMEWMRLTLQTFREQVERLSIESRDLEHDEIERTMEEPELRRRRYVMPARGTRQEIFSCIGESYVLERALARVHDSGEHAVLIELAPMAGGHTLFEWMARAYARARGNFDGFACLRKDGNVLEAARWPEDPAFFASAEMLVLKVVGLCVKDFYELETGTHVWQPLAREPELLRVHVTPAHFGDVPRSRVERYAAAKLDIRRDIELPPIVRNLRFDPPPPRKAATLLELEDYRLGLSLEWHVQELYQALASLWLVRLSRTEPS